LVENHKLDPSALDKVQKQKSGKLRLNLHDVSFGRKIIGLDQKTDLKRAHDFKNQDPN
jgi:hypothetical protein